MPPKKKAAEKRTAAKSSRPTRAAKRSRHSSASEQSASEDDGFFNKSSLQRSISRYDFNELLTASEFDNNTGLIKMIAPEDFNMEYYRKTGLNEPLLFNCDPVILGFRMPKAEDFSVDDVLDLIGPNRMIEVVKVVDQDSVKMSLGDFIKYYKTPKEKRNILYNVLSLEFSDTKMEEVIRSPDLVREIDWVENHWPDALRCRFFSFMPKGNYSLLPTYPKVQHYCLMSVEGSFTDFHIDFGGTSVWYHVLRGEKVFWMVEPTPTNIRLYVETCKDPSATFFGKVVEKCTRVVLKAGDTMIIPAGWIHAVYTPKDSLVFGGNFLHSYRASMQLKVLQSENRINITKKFRFPYFEELLFYVVADFVKKCTGRKYARPLLISEQRADYCGKLWKAKNGHLVPISADRYVNDGLAFPADEVEKVPNAESEQLAGGKAVIAMHMENSGYDRPLDGDLSLQEEASSDDESSMNKSKEPRAEPPPWHNDSTIFYHPPSIFHDLHGRGTMAHKNQLGDEPDLTFIEDEMSKISRLLLIEFEELSDFLRKKRIVEVSEGITMPASLLNAFQKILESRRCQLLRQGVELPDPPGTKKPAVRRTTPSRDGGIHLSRLHNVSFVDENVAEKEADKGIRRKNSGSAKKAQPVGSTPIVTYGEASTSGVIDQEEVEDYVPQPYIPNSTTPIVPEVEYEQSSDYDPAMVLMEGEDEHTEEIIYEEEVYMQEEVVAEQFDIEQEESKEESISEEAPTEIIDNVEMEVSSENVVKAEEITEEVVKLEDSAVETVIPEECRVAEEYTEEVGKIEDSTEDGTKVEEMTLVDCKDAVISSNNADEAATPKETKKRARKAKIKKSTAEIEDEQESKEDGEELLETSTKRRNSASSPSRKKKKKSLTTHAHESFEDALSSGSAPSSKSRKKHDTKKDKPQFIGGLPMAPIQDAPTVPNLYNYDPMSEIQALGKGQLQSAYRKTKANIAPPKDQKIYRLEKQKSDADQGVPMKEKLSVVVADRRGSEGSEALSPSPRTGFMPRLDLVSVSPVVEKDPRTRTHSLSCSRGGDLLMSPGRPLRGKEAQPRPEFGGNGSKSDLPSYMPNVGPSYTRDSAEESSIYTPMSEDDWHPILSEPTERRKSDSKQRETEDAPLPIARSMSTSSSRRSIGEKDSHVARRHSSGGRPADPRIRQSQRSNTNGHSVDKMAAAEATAKLFSINQELSDINSAFK